MVQERQKTITYYVQNCENCNEEVTVRKNHQGVTLCSPCEQKKQQKEAKQEVSFMLGAKVIEVETKKDAYEIDYIKIKTLNGKTIIFEVEDWEERHIGWEECK